MRIQGQTWRIVTLSPYKSEDVPTDLYMLGICGKDGEVTNYVRSGRPSTYRVYESLTECRNGIRSCKRQYTGTLVPVRLLTGEIVKDTPDEAL